VRPFFSDKGVPFVKENSKTCDFGRIAGRFFFAVYLVLLVYFMFFSEEWGRSILGGDYRYNLVPFQEIRRYLHFAGRIGEIRALLNLAGNVIGFMPFGALWPLLQIGDRKAGFWKTALLGMELSLFIEIAQLVLRAGSCDVDDVILNTLGACMGYGLYRWIVRMKEKHEKKEI
jgi:glycopeptide antibiotics resistance protein